MEVLTPYPPLSPSNSHTSLHRLQSPPYVSPRASKSSSLLVRRSSRQGFHPHSAELALSVDRALLVKFHGDSSHSATSLSIPRSAARSMAIPRSFAPLTPIIASPITTPTPSMSSTNTLYLTIDKGAARDKLLALHGGSHHERDYLTKGAPAQTKAIVALETPTWTSTPPTPPPKSLHHRSASSGARRAATSSWVIPSASLPASLSPHAPPHIPSPFTRKRRASLPASLSKPLPQRPLPPKPLPLTPSHSPSPSLKTQRLKQPSRLFESLVQDAMTGEASRPAPKRLFHVPDGSSDREDEGEQFTESPKEMFLDAVMTAQGSIANGESSEDSPSLTEKSKDDVRRYHVLMELLTTEVGYLMDLREMVNGYIRQLPTLSCRPTAHGSSSASLSPFARSSSASTFMPLSASSRTNSHTHMMSLTSPNSSATISDTLNLFNTTPAKDKNTTRYMFSNQEIELVTRNIEEILQFHEAFVDDLRAALTPLGFCMVPEDGWEMANPIHVRQKKKEIGQPEQNLEAAIAIVSKKFTTQASHFTIYEQFCCGQPEALGLVRKIQEEHAVEWEAFEQRSSQLVADMRNPASRSQTVDEHPSSSPLSMDDTENLDRRRKRGYSLSSLDVVSTRSLHAPNTRSNANLKQASSADAHGGRDKSGSRLVFMDYLIKPVQRICKYPLLLVQLKSGKSASSGSPQEDGGSSPGSSYNGESTSAAGGDPDDAVRSALQAMTQVASSVDEACRRQDIVTKSTLIATRILNAFSAQSSSSARSLLGHNLTHNFLSELGACLLAGTMDVIHHQADKIPGSSGTVKAKYLGAFLYMGGYLVLVKAGKGKMYEPKHWFSLVGFEIVDVPEEEALLPCSFRLSCTGHHFEMAAACQREKDVWLSAFGESLVLRGHWPNEPASSLHTDTRNDFLFSMHEDGPSDDIPPVPPLPFFQQSASPIERGSPPSAFSQPNTLSSSSKTLRPEIPSRQDPVSLSASRRSSTASVKAIFSPMSESTILIRRSSPPARLQVERRLHDVFSDVCLSARYHASTHEEELFQAPKLALSGFSRSNSGLGMAGMGVAAKNRLTKRESVLVHRRKSSVDSHGALSEADFQMGVSKRLSTAKSLANRRHMKKLKIMSLPTTLSSECEDGGDIMPDSPLALSQCSSVTASNAGSAAGSPVKDTNTPSRIVPVRSNTNIPRPDLLLVRESDYRPKRSRSMVDNVKGIFQSRSSSPASSLSGDQSLPTTPEGPHPQLNASINSGLFKWWSGSLRRRVRSAPDSPEDGPSFTKKMISTSSLTLSKPGVTRRNTDGRSDFLSTSDSGQLRTFIPPTDTNASSLPFQQYNSSPPIRRRSLFSPTSSYRRQTIASTGSEPVPPKLQRSLTFLQRLSPLNSTVSADVVPHVTPL